MSEDKKRKASQSYDSKDSPQYRNLKGYIKSQYRSLDRAVSANFLAKITGDPFDDSEVIGIAQKVLAEINKLPRQFQHGFGSVRQYALDVMTLLSPVPADSYAKPEALQMERLRSEVAGLYSRVG